MKIKPTKTAMIHTCSVMILLLILAGCVQNGDSVNENWEIGSQEYADITEQAMMHMQNMDFDAWGELLADDIEYYFPDGDEGTRTVITGKEAVVEWWKNWEATTGIESMRFSSTVFLPAIALEALSYSGLSGPYVVSYLSNEMVFNGQTVNVRMNFTVHFNEENKIDRYFSYYDRVPIIRAMGTNILSNTEEK